MRLFVVAAVLLATTAPAIAVDITWGWTAPTEGSPVAHYVFQVATDGGAFTAVGTSTTTSIVVDMPIGTSVARVAGVDALGRQGPWSPVSDPYTDAGPPGAPGTPTWSLVLGALAILGALVLGAIMRARQNG